MNTKRKIFFFFVGRDLLIDSCKPSGSNYVYENMILMKIYFTENDFIFNDGMRMFVKCFMKATENVKCENFPLNIKPTLFSVSIKWNSVFGK